MSQAAAGAHMGPIEQVKAGMAVFDLDGRDLGRVEFVKMGDPDAVTTRGQDIGRDGGLVEAFWRAFGQGEPQISEPSAQRLLRIGFVKVDGKGLFGRDLYVAGDQIASVAGDVVSLRVSADQLVAEHS